MACALSPLLTTQRTQRPSTQLALIATGAPEAILIRYLKLYVQTADDDLDEFRLTATRLHSLGPRRQDGGRERPKPAGTQTPTRSDSTTPRSGGGRRKRSGPTRNPTRAAVAATPSASSASCANGISRIITGDSCRRW